MRITCHLTALLLKRARLDRLLPKFLSNLKRTFLPARGIGVTIDGEYCMLRRLRPVGVKPW